MSLILNKTKLRPRSRKDRLVERVSVHLGHSPRIPGSSEELRMTKPIARDPYTAGVHSTPT